MTYEQKFLCLTWNIDQVEKQLAFSREYLQKTNDRIRKTNGILAKVKHTIEERNADLSLAYNEYSQDRIKRKYDSYAEIYHAIVDLMNKFIQYKQMMVKLNDQKRKFEKTISLLEKELEKHQQEANNVAKVTVESV